MSNLTDFTFYDPLYMPQSYTNTVELGQVGYCPRDYVFFPLDNLQRGYTEYFGFGIQYDDGTISYTQINNDIYWNSEATNSTQFTLESKGLGLPTQSYQNFARLMAILTKG
jgi:hypothetical protein